MTPLALRALRVAALAVLGAAASVIGLSTYDPAITVALIFPSSGVAVLWFATSTRRSLVVDVPAFALATILGALLIDVSLPAAVMAAVVAVSHGLVWYGAVLRLARGRALQMDTLRGVSIFMAGCAAGAVVSAGLRGLGLGLLPSPGVVDTALTALRNFSWSLGLGGSALLLLPFLSPMVTMREHRRAIRWSPALVSETLAMVAATGWVCWLAFGPQPRALAFLLMLAVLWAALRMPPAAAVTGAFVLGIVGLVSTLQRQSAFVSMGRELEGAVLAQVFLVSMELLALVIAIGTWEREAATERARVAEAEAEARARLFSAVIENLDEGVTVITADDDYTVRNRAARRLTGVGGFLTPVGGDQSQPRMLAEDGTPLELADMPHSRARAESRTVRESVRVRLPDGAERFLDISSIPVPGLAGDERTVVVNTLRDTTQDHEERDQLVSFAGVVAHDLKNPLTVIGGWSESLQEELASDAPPDVAMLRSMVDRVQSASAQMRGFIDDLLAMTVARDRALQREPLDLSELAEEVAELRRTGPSQARVSVQPGMAVVADRFLVRQLLDNLVGNAVKYVAPSVRPSITVSAHETDDDLEISITDNGIGIPPEARQRVFDTFVRAHDTGYSGTGLGLSICERVVTRHGGRIWVADHDGPGTQVRFTLPRH